jgi:hypothetical protein
MSLWIYVILVLGILGWLLIPIRSTTTTIKVTTRTIVSDKVRVKFIKCPRCGEKVDPIAEIIVDKMSHCANQKCGLELVNLSKLHKRFIPILSPPKTTTPKEETDVITLNYLEPLEIHVYSAREKTVM